MLTRRIVGALYTSFLVFQVVAGFAAATISAIVRADPEKVRAKSAWLADLVQVTQDWAWLAVPLLVFLTGALGLLRKLLGAPWLWQTIHSCLNDFRADAFKIQPEDADHYHRVTLFRHKRWCWVFQKWPWSGWLVAVERSGHTTQQGISRFRAPDNADQAQGIAGMTWARNREVGVSNLPDLAKEPTYDNIKAYAKATGLAPSVAKKRLPKARSLYGIPVEVKGNPWGVIVLDSRSPDGISQEAVRTFYRPLGKFLPKLLERLL